MRHLCKAPFSGAFFEIFMRDIRYAPVKCLVEFTLREKSEVEEQFASDSERNSKPRGNGAAALRQAVE